LYGPQSPSYDYRLVGQGELVLTDIRRPRSSVVLPSGFDRMMILSPGRGVEAEVPLAAALRIALPPAHYRLEATRDDKRFTAELELGSDETRSIRDMDFAETAREVPLPAASFAPQEFRPGQLVPSAVGKDSPYFCEGVRGEWKACRGSGCQVCSEMLTDYPLYFRNHPNCIASGICEKRYFECSPNCPAPSPADSCQAPADGWRGCQGGCAVCSELVASFPRYFTNHPSCIPVPGRCRGHYVACSVNCPAPSAADR
jgi:hypothetical protein